MNINVITDFVANEVNFVSIVIDCDDNEDRYVSVLGALNVDRNDVIDEKSPLVYTSAELPNGIVVVQYRAGKPDTDDSDSDEEE